MQETSGAVSAGAGVPLHRQLFLVLHDEIARGAIAPGDALPTEQSLCDQFGVSRITVRRALADLADQGYIERRQGVGSFVRQRRSVRRGAAVRLLHGQSPADAIPDDGRRGRARHPHSAVHGRRRARRVCVDAAHSASAAGAQNARSTDDHRSLAADRSFKCIDGKGITTHTTLRITLRRRYCHRSDAA